jgi:hypothetical protein
MSKSSKQQKSKNSEEETPSNKNASKSLPSVDKELLKKTFNGGINKKSKNKEKKTSSSLEKPSSSSSSSEKPSSSSNSSPNSSSNSSSDSTSNQGNKNDELPSSSSSSATTKKRKTNRKSKIGCELLRKLYVRDHIRIGGNELPSSLTKEQFFNSSLVPPAPATSILHRFLKNGTYAHQKRKHVEIQLKNLLQEDKKGKGSSSSSNEANLNAALIIAKREPITNVNITTSATVRLTHACDQFFEFYFSKVHILTRNQALTVTPKILETAFDILISSPDYIGPKYPKSINDIRTIFALCDEVEKLKRTYPNRNLRSDDKEQYKSKKKELLTAAKNEIEKQFPSYLYCGEGLAGTLKRYQIRRSSPLIQLIAEVMQRVFLNEIIQKCHNFISAHDTNSFSEGVVIFSLNSCGFKCVI